MLHLWGKNPQFHLKGSRVDGNGKCHNGEQMNPSPYQELSQTHSAYTSNFHLTGYNTLGTLNTLIPL
jgi:hypothetical protein